MTQTVLLWALWVAGTGAGYSGGIYPATPEPVAFFTTMEECEEVRKLLEQAPRWSRCIGARYVAPKVLP